MKIPIPGRKKQDPLKPLHVTGLDGVFFYMDAAEKAAKERAKKMKKAGSAMDVDDFSDTYSYRNDSQLSLTDGDSFSTNATMDNNIGAGRTLDNVFFQPAGRKVEQLADYVAFLWRGSRVEPPLRPRPRTDDSSLSSHSTTSTVTDNIGPGRTLDKYVYQVIGKMLERCMGRIAMSKFLSSRAIANRIAEVWKNAKISTVSLNTYQYEHLNATTIEREIKGAISRMEEAISGAFILSGVKEIIKRIQYVTNTYNCKPLTSVSCRIDPDHS